MKTKYIVLVLINIMGIILIWKHGYATDISTPHWETLLHIMGLVVIVFEVIYGFVMGLAYINDITDNGFIKFWNKKWW